MEYIKDRMQAEINALKKRVSAYEEMLKEQAWTEVTLFLVGLVIGLGIGLTVKVLQ